MATLVPPTAAPPPPVIQPEKVDYLNLPCPIPYEEIQREALSKSIQSTNYVTGFTSCLLFPFTASDWLYLMAISRNQKVI